MVTYFNFLQQSRLYEVTLPRLKFLVEHLKCGPLTSFEEMPQRFCIEKQKSAPLSFVSPNRPDQSAQRMSRDHNADWSSVSSLSLQKHRATSKYDVRETRVSEIFLCFVSDTLDSSKH